MAPVATYEGTGASSAKRVEVDFDTNRLIVLLALDDILPFYDPEFVSASNNPLEDEDLVLGLALNGEAKAYTVGVLDHRGRSAGAGHLVTDLCYRSRA